jgi:hypothetical protein
MLDYLDVWEKRAKHRGLLETVQHYKHVRLSFTRWLCGHPLSSIGSVSLDEDGFPKELASFKAYLTSDLGLEERTKVLRVIMTLLTFGRSFKFKPVLDVSSIIGEDLSKPLMVSDNDHKNILRRLKIKESDCLWEDFHMSTKKGPNGPAMSTSLTDLTSLPLETIKDLILIGGDKLGFSIKKCFMQTPLDNLSIIDIWKKIHNKQPSHPRKLSYFSDKEGKTRVIAILDYWTQTALRPLHFHLMDLLRGIKSDCTFNQEGFISKLPSSGPYYCFDLHAATDRMPISLQKRLLSSIIGEERSEAWARLLVSQSYTNRDLPENVFYVKGQPMGAYSSWASMALTHHYIVQLASLRAGFNQFFKDYVLLGDDLVIANDAVAVQYKILCSILDMPISEQKTHVSLDTYEFAKRWVYRGVEITGYSIGGLIETWKRYSTLHEFIENQQRHGWDLPVVGRPGFISAVYNSFGRSSERPIKLYLLYYYIKKIGKSSQWVPEKEVYSNQLLNYITSAFGIPRPLTDSCYGISTSFELVTGVIQEVKLRIVERDIERIFSTNDLVSEKLNQQFLTFFPNLGIQPYRALLRETSPAIQVMNNVLRQTVDYINRLASDDESVNIFELGISRFFIAEGIFSLRTAHSISLAESQLTKWFLYVLRERLESEARNFAHALGYNLLENLKPSSYYEPDAMRRREKLQRTKRSVKRNQTGKAVNTVRSK